MNTIQTTHKIKGGLFLVAMPLGNIEDLSPRAKHTLEEADFILAEDTKRAGILLSRCNINTKDIFSLNEHNEQEKIPLILRKLSEEKEIALISDAGMPLISDPGYLLVSACHEVGYKVSVIPGPCAPVTALALSGIAPLPFTFLGFLARNDKDKEKTLSPYTNINSTLIFFERKDRLYTSLSLCLSLFNNRKVAIARELTKTHEEIIHFKLKELEEKRALLESLLGEITVVLGPPLEEKISSPQEIDALIEEERAQASSPRNLAKRVQSRSCGWKTSDIYKRI